MRLNVNADCPVLSTRILLCKAGGILGFTTQVFENPGQSPNARSNWRLDTRSCQSQGANGPLRKATSISSLPEQQLHKVKIKHSNNQTTTSGQALGFGVLGCTSAKRISHHENGRDPFHMVLRCSQIQQVLHVHRFHTSCVEALQLGYSPTFWSEPSF